jgi:hypothetical protein
MIKPFNNDPFGFYCYVEEEGYEWTKARADSEPRLIGRGDFQSRTIVGKLPRGVFLEFADLSPTQESIQKFAARYGNLFDRHDVIDTEELRGRILGGSTFKKWKEAIDDMGCLVRLWEAIKKQNKKELRKAITWNSKGVRYTIQNRGVWLTHAFSPDPIKFKPGDPIMPARYALQAELNRRIADPENVTVPRLVWTREDKGAGDEEKYQRIVFTPPSLLAAMWLQFAQTLTGKSELKVCKGCKRHFLAGPGGRRANAETCRDACRQLKYRRRKQKSIRPH